MAEHDLISKTALLEHLDMAMECENCPRNANKELYKCVHNPTPERCTCSDIAQICVRITEFATFADVQPMKHGRWIAENRDSRGYADCYTCTNCNCYSYTYTLMKDCEYEYCPNCGARMDAEPD